MSGRASDSAGRRGPDDGQRPARPARPRSTPDYEPVGRRPEDPVGTSGIGLGGEGSWAPEDAKTPRVPDAAGRPTIDPARAMPPIPPRLSTAEDVPRVGVRATAGRLQGERACSQCGYNLRGVALGGRCPECGQPVGDAAPPRDGPLGSAAPHVVRTVALGSALAGFPVAVVWATAALQIVAGLPAEFVAWVHVGAALSWAGGIFLLTGVQQDPVARFNGMHERDPWRLAARWTAIKLPVFAVLGVVPFILARAAVAPPGAGGAPAAAPVAPGTLDVLSTVRMIVLPIALVAFGLGLVVMRRIAVWTRDGFAERAIDIAQWTVPIGVLLLAVAGPGIPGAPARIAGPQVFLILFLVAHATLAGGLISLTASAVLSVQHERERVERERRRAERRDDAHAAMHERIDRASDS